ncbi:Retinoblastoma-like protein 1 [Geodia barretti]|uniref:Retinoblastoma-like protein 1 n=3 Tax=Geodia barretti TaxID=519541 RepID=A0AA35SFQ5_GEOBA|nr:Retinoblastoma-like protein 1 [Geodia barretti]
MSGGGELPGVVRARYEDVCAELNMDEETAEKAWSSYKNINNDYVLEGDHIEWLGCALYVAGQLSTMETVEGVQATGNNVSLTHILRSTKLSLIEFFKKMKKWQEMTKLLHDFQKKIDTLERKFEVASIIFSKYHRVFHDLFSPLDEKPTAASRRGGRKKHGNKPCSTAELFKFGWTLYIHIKGQYPQINDDLVNSHHLLLCCMDMLFCAAVAGKRRDLLNPDCPLLPQDFASPNFVTSDDKMCVLTELSEQYGAIEKECRVIRDFYWRGPMKRMFEKKELSGLQAGNLKHSVTIDSAFVNMISYANFHSNQRALDREYEINMLANGDFDERMFLHPNASEEIGTPSRLNTTLSARLMMTQTPPHHVQYRTPLLGREYLTTASNSMTPVSDATHSVTQLHLLLENKPPSPAEDLCRMCGSCTANPLPDIERRVASLGEAFLRCSPQETETTPDSFTKLRLHLATSLYYKLLLGVVRDEAEVKKVNVTTLQIMLEHELFHKALFALSTEIVLFSYNSHSRVFPWVLGVFEVSAYHFYKVIEVAIKVETNLPRSIIKHLNRVEENVLDYLAWTSDSPLYDAIEAAGSASSYEDVALPPPTAGGMATPLVHHTHSRVASSLAGLRGEASPIATFLREQLVSPSSARRQLFSPSSTTSSKKTPGKLGSGTPTRPIPIAPKPAVGSSGGTSGGVGGGTVTVTLLRDYLQQQHSSISQQLQGAISPGTSPSSGGSPGRLDPASPLRLAVSMASAGTQTSPCRPLSSNLVGSSHHSLNGRSTVSWQKPLCHRSGCKPQSVIWREASPDWISPGISLPSIFIPLLLLHPPLPSHPQCLHHTLTIQDATATTRLRPLSHLHPLHPHQILEPPSSQENGLLGPVLQEGVYDRSPEDQGPV